MVCRSHIYEWLDNQSQPIEYKELVSHFNYIASITTEKPPIFDTDFRALTQILAVTAPPVSVAIIQKILPNISDIENNVYGVAIGITDELEVALIKKKLEENNLIISNVNKNTFENKFLIWVTGSSDFIPTQRNLGSPDLMQQYWRSRHLNIQKNGNVKETRVISSVKKELANETITTKNREEVLPSVTSFYTMFNPRNDKWVVNYDRIKNIEINRDELEKAIDPIKKDKTNAVFFDASISLSTQLDFNPYTMTRPKFFAFICLNANPNYQDYFGQTPLHYIIGKLKPNLPKDKRQQLINVIDWLIESGADLNLTNNEGKTPLSLAKEARISDELLSILTKNSKAGLKFK
jgi:Ankyrin repeat